MNKGDGRSPVNGRIPAWLRGPHALGIVAAIGLSLTVTGIVRSGTDVGNEERAAGAEDPAIAGDGAEWGASSSPSPCEVADPPIADASAALADFRRYLSGENTETVRCRTRHEEMVLRRWEERYLALGEPGITVFWDQECETVGASTAPAESRRGRLSLDGETIDGWIELERIDGDWFVVGVETTTP